MELRNEEVPMGRRAIDRFKVIQKVLEHRLNKRQAAQQLGLGAAPGHPAMSAGRARRRDRRGAPLARAAFESSVESGGFGSSHGVAERSSLCWVWSDVRLRKVSGAKDYVVRVHLAAGHGRGGSLERP